MLGDQPGFDPYVHLAELYDLEHQSFRDDIGLYLSLAEVVGDPVLELGCGTGRILTPLATAGNRVTGVDRSQPMLDRASVAIDQARVKDRVSLVCDDMANADKAPGGPFGLIIFSLNGFMHLASPREQRRALASARRALDPRGMLVIDSFNPIPELLATLDGRVQHEGSWSRPDGTQVDRFSSRTYSATEQLIRTELWYDETGSDGQVQRVRTRFPMRYVTRAELELILELAGFVEWQVYGSYDLDPCDDLSDRLIVAAEVSPSRSD